MISSQAPIGIIDSGIGGFTVVSEIQKLLPNESIIYIGDNRNCPYGNRDEKDISKLTKKMLDFLKTKNTKAVAIACNTISSALNECKNDYNFKIESIIYPTVKYIQMQNIKEVGIIATEFTVKTGYYLKLLNNISNDIKVYSQSSPILATLIDNGDFSSSEIDKEIKTQIDKLLTQSPTIENIILACTHYPIIIERFQKFYPQINFINPAYEQAMSVCNYLKSTDNLNATASPCFEVYATGPTSPIDLVCQKLNINPPQTISRINLDTIK
ncbi:MAG: glutamate racemase [Oscillospiraceae bacterium]